MENWGLIRTKDEVCTSLHASDLKGIKSASIWWTIIGRILIMYYRTIMRNHRNIFYNIRTYILIVSITKSCILYNTFTRIVNKSFIQ